MRNEDRGNIPGSLPGGHAKNTNNLRYFGPRAGETDSAQSAAHGGSQKAKNERWQMMMKNENESARYEAGKEQMELEKKQLRIELIGSGACTAEGFETIWNIIRRVKQ